MKTSRQIGLMAALLVVSAFAQNSFSQLSGTYTIGTGENYETISLATNALLTAGVNGPVTFNIKTGSYDESVTIDSIPGASAVNTVTFKSQSGNAADVIWYSSNVNSAFTLKIKRADYLTLKNISFANNNSSAQNRSRIYLENNCRDIKILDNIFSGTLYKDNGLFCSDASMSNLIVKGNLFGLKNGIWLRDLYTKSSGTKISDNVMNCVYGVVILNHDDLTLEKNDFNCSSVVGGSPSPSCIRAEGCNGNLKIIANKLIATSIEDAEDGIVVGYYTGENALIANNFIALKTGTGMWIDYSHNINIYHNTVVTASVSSGDITFVGCYGVINSKNNIMINLANRGERSLTYFIFNSVVPHSDYNLFLYYNPLMAYLTPDYITNLAMLQSVAGCDLHSVEWQVNFVSATDLHLAGSSIGDINLKGTPVSEVTTDIDGNPRSSTRPYMGADEAAVPLSVTQLLTGLPIQFSLSQNYPNPFNPATKITYSLPDAMFTVLKIYDILGNEVATLVNENQNAGTYSIEWDAGNFSSGTYFCKLTSGNFTDTKKMFLLK